MTTESHDGPPIDPLRPGWTLERLMAAPTRVVPRIWPLTQRLLIAQRLTDAQARTIRLLSELLAQEQDSHRRTLRMRDVLLDYQRDYDRDLRRRRAHRWRRHRPRRPGYASAADRAKGMRHGRRPGGD